MRLNISHLEAQKKTEKISAYNPARGVTPATKAKAIASGTKARDTVRPDNNSTLNNEKETPSLGIYSSLLKPIELAN